jgi:hypothetical protein
VIIDSLHLTHCFRPGVLNWKDVEDFDERLASLGFGLLFLEATPEVHWKRGIQERKDDDFITQYSKKFGDSLADIHAYFMREQANMKRLSETSKMEKLTLSCSLSDDQLIDAAYGFWQR